MVAAVPAAPSLLRRESTGSSSFSIDAVTRSRAAGRGQALHSAVPSLVFGLEAADFAPVLEVQDEDRRCSDLVAHIIVPDDDPVDLVRFRAGSFSPILGIQQPIRRVG